MLKRRVFLASFVLTGGRLFARGLDMVATIAIARFLTPDDFGVVTLATAALLLVQAATAIPVSDALVQKEGEVDRADLDTAFTLGAVRGMLVCLVLAAAAYPVAELYEDDRLFDLFLVISAAPLVAGFHSPCLVLLVRQVNYLPATLIEVSAKLTAFVIAITVAYYTQSYWSLVIALVAPSAIMMPMTYFAAPHRPKFSFARFRFIASFAGWISASNLFSNLSNGGDRFVIGALLSSSAIGFFSMANTMATAVSWTAGVPLMQSLFPAFSKIQNDPERMKGAFLQAQSMTVFTLLPMGVGLALVAEPTVRTFLNEQWLPLVPLLQVLAPVSALLAALYMPVQAAALALGRPAQIAAREFIVFAVGLPAVLWATSEFGLLGAVWARCSAGLLHLGMNTHIAYKMFGIRPTQQILNCRRSLISLAVMVPAVLLFRQIIERSYSLPDLTILLSCALVGASVYSLSHILSWLLLGKPDGPEKFAIDLWKDFRRPSAWPTG